MVLKIFLISDVHIGMSFTRYQKVREQLVKDRIDVVKRAVALANSKECDLFVIAGDLFDKVTVKSSVIKEVAIIVSAFLGEVVILPGNHDYYSGESDTLWSKFESESSERVTLLKDGTPLLLENLPKKVKIHPCPCDKKHSKDNRLALVKEEELADDAINIGIGHGSLKGVSPDFDGRYFPMDFDQLMGAGVDYWFLGHTHISYPEHFEAEHGTIFYSGTPAPDGFDCKHNGYGIYFEIKSKHELVPLKEELGKYLFRELALTVDSSAIFEERIKSFIRGSVTQQILLKLIIKGRVPVEDRAEIMNYLLEIEDKFMLLKVDTTNLLETVDIKMIEREFLKDSFPYRLLTSLLNNKDEAGLQLAYDLIREVKR